MPARSPKRSAPEGAHEPVKIGELARLAGVPAATVKHYLREGLIVPERSGRNIAYYARHNVERIRRIKELQQNGFLPLKVIRDVLDSPASELDTIEETIRRALRGEGDDQPRTRTALLAGGVSAAELDWLRAAGAIQPLEGVAEESYGGDDLELLRTLGAARSAGLSADMLPFSIVGDYVEAIRNLVRVELTLFREGVVPRARDRLPAITHAATTLSERLVVLLRRRMLIPVLRGMTTGRTPAEERPRPPAKRPARAPLTRPRKSRK